MNNEIENKHNRMIKGFSHLSRTYYGESILHKNDDFVDEVNFGFYDNQGCTTGEMYVQWVKLDNQVYPKLSVLDGSWSALAQFHDLIDLLAQHDDKRITPDEFCQLLLQCGFKDITETRRE